jgi:hypothetical protein
MTLMLDSKLPLTRKRLAVPDPGVRQEPQAQDEPNVLTQIVPGTSDREIYDRLKAAKGQPLNVYDDSQGRTRTFRKPSFFDLVLHPTKGIPLDMRATPIPPDQLRKAYDEAAGFLDSIDENHPILSNAIMNNPQLLPLLPEIGFMLNGSEIATSIVGGLLDVMPDAVGYRSYADTMYETPVQQMFLNDVVSKMDSEAQDLVAYMFAGLEERGADRVASLAFAWMRDNPVSTQQQQMDLLLRLHNWGVGEQQTELHDDGIFGLLDAPQEAVEDLLEIPVSGLIGWLGSPEEAIRRSGLTLGQQAAYQNGNNPDDEEWQIYSGILDAAGEVLLDPLNLVAGIGSGIKAAKTIPLGASALAKGRLAFAARSAVPFAGRTAAGALPTRSITARITYAFKAKTADNLISSFGKSKAGREAFDLLKEGNRARFMQRFPSLNRLPETFYDAAKLTNDPEDMAELMKSVHAVGNMRDPEVLADATRTLERAKAALDNVKKESGVGRHELDPVTVKPIAPLELDVLKAQMRVDNIKATPSKVFVVVDGPRRPQRSLYGLVEGATRGHQTGAANTMRRWAHDLTRSVPSDINLFHTRRSVPQLRSLLEHYGVEAGRTDDLLNEYIGLDIGDRMQFMLKTVVPAIGDATKNPLLRYNLVEFYRRSGVQSFAPGFDEAVDGAGDISHLPLLDTNMQASFKFNVKEVDDIIGRYNAANGRIRGMFGERRGLVPSTKSARATLVNRLRNLSADTEGLADEDLYAMAYSWIGQGIDPRNWMSRHVGQPTGQLLHKFDTAFRKSMLASRAGQWVFKVVGLEEQIRSHIWEMPNAYTKPMSWANRILENHYLNKTDDWAKKQVAWVDDVRAQIFAGVKTPDEAIAAVRETFGAAADEILDGDIARSVSDINRAVASWTHKAALDKVQVGTLPGATLSRRLRAWRITKASNIKSEELLGASFRPADDIQDIMHKNWEMFFGDELATAQSGVVPFAWKPEMSTFARRRYGNAWGGKVTELTHSQVALWSLRRMAAREAGEVPAALSAAAFMETSTWKLMKGNIRRFYPDEANDARRVERFFDERVDAWAENVLQPFLSQGTVNRADFLTELVERKHVVGDLNGTKYDIDLRSEGSARRKLEALAVDQAPFARTTPFPEEIAAVLFDPRFMDNSADRAMWRQGVDNLIRFFGEDASQVLSRRPFWRAQRKRWLDLYTDMGIDSRLAAELASEKASKMVNYVMYDISEAPTVVKKLNSVIPFFGAAYEVMSTWTYKMPVAVGGYWAFGAGGFARKMDRLMRAFVNTGLVTVSEQDGRKDYELQLWREPNTGTPLGDALSKIGYHIRRSPENAIATFVSMFGESQLNDALKAGQAVTAQSPYGFTLGNPLNPMDFGILSFAQFHIGMNPAQNWIVNSTVGRLMPAADVQRVESGDSDTTLADLADKLDVDPDDLARANRSLILGANTGEQYKGLFEDEVDPADIIIPAGNFVTLPNSSLFESMVEETFFPFGEIDSPAGVIRGMVPAMWQHVLRGFGILGTPADGAWLDDSQELDSVPFFSNPETQAAVNSQMVEAMYFLESTEGTFSKIGKLVEQYAPLEAAGGGPEADALLAEIEALNTEAVKRVTDLAGGSMILRGLAGGFFPNTGRVLRQEMQAIDGYWNSRDFAEQLRGNDADGKPLTTLSMGRVKSFADIEDFFSLAAQWYDDPTGDGAKSWIRQNNPQLFAYLQPKTFWGEAGAPPEITSYEDYLDQIRSGQRKPVPLAVAIQRHLHAGVESDYWMDFVNNFGNDPEAAASNAMENVHIYDSLQDARFSQHDALDMSDDLHGGEYLKWLDERGSHDDDTYESVEKARDNFRNYMDTLGSLLELELDANLTPAEIRDHRTIIKTTMARLNELSEEQESEDLSWKNPYELAQRTYWDDVYAKFNEAIDPIWDAIAESTDTEETSLLFENLKLEMNSWAQKRFTLFGREDITFPSPLDVKWNRKTEEEKKAFAMKRSTLPLEWLNLDDVERILSFAPADAASFFPTTTAEMEIYTNWTVRKNEIEEMAEMGLLTESERRKAQDAAEEEVHSYLMETGRQDEITYASLWPIERLYVTNQLPHELHDVMPQLRFIKESLAAEGRGPRSQIGDKLLTPLYQELTNRALTDPAFGNMLSDLGLTLFDESAFDALLPKLIVGGFESDF